MENHITSSSTCKKVGLTVFVYPSIPSTHHMTTYAVHTHTYAIVIFVHTTQVQLVSRDDRTTTALPHARASRQLIRRPLTTASRRQLMFNQRMRYRPSPPKRSCRERRNYCPSNQLKKSAFILPLLLLLYVFHIPSDFFY